jgi:hypothetical protein
MKNTGKIFCFTAIIMAIVITLALASCKEEPEDADASITYTGDIGAKTYTLVIAKSLYRSAYKPQDNDEYVMIINDNVTEEITTSTGTVKSITDGIFKLAGSEGGSFKVTVTGKIITKIEGEIPKVDIVINSIDAFIKWLEKMSANTVNTSYPVMLKITDNDFSALTEVHFYQKYVCLELIGSTLTTIPEWAFLYCTGLTSVTIGSGVTSIGDSAFSGCTGLTSVTIGSGVTSIGDSAFSFCTGLASVTIGSGVTSIGDSAFSGCTGLTSVTIPNSVTRVRTPLLSIAL